MKNCCMYEFHICGSFLTMCKNLSIYKGGYNRNYDWLKVKSSYSFSNANYRFVYYTSKANNYSFHSYINTGIFDIKKISIAQGGVISVFYVHFRPSLIWVHSAHIRNLNLLFSSEVLPICGSNGLWQILYYSWWKSGLETWLTASKVPALPAILVEVCMSLIYRFKMKKTPTGASLHYKKSCLINQKLENRAFISNQT